MQDTWQAFLLQQGATIKDDVIDFDTSALNLKETALISPLSDFAMLALRVTIDICFYTVNSSMISI
jgi:hypothetical protein